MSAPHCEYFTSSSQSTRNRVGPCTNLNHELHRHYCYTPYVYVMLTLHSGCETEPLQIDKASTQHRPILCSSIRGCICLMLEFHCNSVTDNYIKLLVLKLFKSLNLNGEVSLLRNMEDSKLFHDAVYIPCQSVLHFLKRHTVSWCTSKYNLMNNGNISYGFP